LIGVTVIRIAAGIGVTGTTAGHMTGGREVAFKQDRFGFAPDVLA
jgi:hypothetical protein